MLDIAIVDDEHSERERLKACLAYVEEQQGVSFSVQEYESADQFLMMFEQQFDIVFLDIQFSQGMDGMNAARQLRKTDPSVLLIFVTNLAQMALHGYEVDALDFVVKPWRSAGTMSSTTHGEAITLSISPWLLRRRN